MTERAEVIRDSDRLAEVSTYLQGLGIFEAQLQLLCGGCHNEVYLCENALPVFSQKVVVRVPTCPEAARSIEANAIYLANSPAPQTLHIGKLARHGGLIAIEEHIEGKHRDLNNLTPEEIRALAEAVADMHQQESSCFSNTSGTAPICSGTYTDYIQAMLVESVIDRMRHVDMDPYPEVKQLVRAGQQKLYRIMSAQPKLFGGSRFTRLHHDLSKRNILQTPNGWFRLIDANTTFGDPADDVGYIVTDNQGGAKFKQIFFDAYSDITGSDEVIARTDAHTIKNQLDDLIWLPYMRQRSPNDERYGQAAYERRVSALQATLWG